MTESVLKRVNQKKEKASNLLLSNLPASSSPKFSASLATVGITFIPLNNSLGCWVWVAIGLLVRLSFALLVCVLFFALSLAFIPFEPFWVSWPLLLFSRLPLTSARFASSSFVPEKSRLGMFKWKWIGPAVSSWPVFDSGWLIEKLGKWERKL